MRRFIFAASIRKVALRRVLGDSNSVNEAVFLDDVMDQIRVRSTRYHEHAYLFVLAALEYSQQRLSNRRHVDGRELSLACRDLALERFGVMGRLVLAHWGVTSTEDFGRLVFTLVEAGLLIRQQTDSQEDFVEVFSFDETFDSAYPWSAAHLA
ncbi:MAG: Minf_1886 family protein [Gemmatimonadaceae bacterium]